MDGFNKSPKLSAALHETILKRCRAAEPLELPGVPTALFGIQARVDPHHLVAVYPDQRRRSNPIVAELTRRSHDHIHAHPELERELRPVLLAASLKHLCADDTECWEAAVKGVIEHLAEREKTL